MENSTHVIPPVTAAIMWVVSVIMVIAGQCFYYWSVQNYRDAKKWRAANKDRTEGAEKGDGE